MSQVLKHLRTTRIAVLGAIGASVLAAPAQDADVPETFAVHGQFTYVEQEDSGFTSPYAAVNSLSPNAGRETADATLYLGVAPWSGTQLWINAEIDQGFGLNDTLGVAGFPSGEAYKIGADEPYLRVPRVFLRQTLNGIGERESVAPDANELGGERSLDRWVFTVGKFAVTDVFDDNQYAHDPRGDFLNWAAIDSGAFDYAADAWGFTLGAAAEWYRGAWTLRAGVFDLSQVPNGTRLEAGFDEFQTVTELEHRHEIAGHAGKLLITGFESRGRMGLLDEAVAFAQTSGTPADIAAVRRYRSRFGGLVNLEQEVTPGLGLFARYGKAAGNVEAYEFSDIDRSLAAGVSLKGTTWHRDHDTAGLALIDNGISAARERYLNAGGLGILIGDGKLPHPGPEEILEAYYRASLASFADLSLDYQYIDNPAYNRDRGPVSVFAVRLHAQF